MTCEVRTMGFAKEMWGLVVQQTNRFYFRSRIGFEFIPRVPAIEKRDNAINF